ncbi:MAG: hypothetical protein HOC09_33600 [Deltaproteobacteria bacterium]|jgi:hypothetical protein|nr:hypothetical protein [Deltaproteobacteria bacterium]
MIFITLFFKLVLNSYEYLNSDSEIEIKRYSKNDLAIQIFQEEARKERMEEQRKKKVEQRRLEAKQKRKQKKHLMRLSKKET